MVKLRTEKEKCFKHFALISKPKSTSQNQIANEKGELTN